MKVVAGPNRLGTALVSALFFCLACGGSYGARRATPVAQASVGQGDVITATCRSVDPTAKTFQVITGMGLALRLETFTVGDQTTITLDGQPIQLTGLEPGYVLRIGYERRATEHYAMRVEAFRVEKGGR
jgi:hypothetical protein